MVRAACCEKMGLKKGPWTPQEDQILIFYIQNHGHGNWRALPKQAGLLRCGKSCRLRWINYLRPDIKRGNFTEEEEDTIIKLHEEIGNRWSAIATKLPGRTDNEIKNVWHTYLKKKLKSYDLSQTTKSHSTTMPKCNSNVPKMANRFESNQIKPSHKAHLTTPFTPINHTTRGNGDGPVSPPESSSEMSSVTYSSAKDVDRKGMDIKQEEIDSSSEYFPSIDESNFWKMQIVNEISSTSTDSLTMNSFTNGRRLDTKSEEMSSMDESNKQSDSHGVNRESNVERSSKFEDDMDFWFNLFIKPGDLPDLL